MAEIKIKPLNSIDLEQLVIGAVLVQPHLLASVPDLRPEHFSHPLHGKVFEVAKAMRDADDRINPVTVADRMAGLPMLEDAGGKGYLTKLAATAGITAGASVANYASGIIDTYGRGQIQDALVQALNDLEASPFDQPTESIAGKIAKILDDVAHNQSAKSIKTVSDVVEEMIASAEQIGAPISTGLPRIDAALDGGLYRGNLYGFMARMKTGKTLMLAQLAYNVALANHRVLYIAGEMGARQIEARNLSRFTHERQSRFRGDSLKDPMLQQRMRAWAQKMGDSLLYQDAQGLTLSKLKAMIDSAVHLHKIEAFCLDYWQLVNPDDPRMNRTEHLDRVAQWLAETCKRHSIVGIVAGQTNREGQARFGDGLAMAADVCFDICRPDDTSSSDRWLEMRQTRYTAWNDVGSETQPSYRIAENGSHLEELPA
jgi:replicative DNA helicase